MEQARRRAAGEDADEWVGRSPQDRAEVVSVQNAEQQLDMLPDSLAMR